MAVNKPVGDNARKGAVRKRTQRKGALMGDCLDETQQGVGAVHGREEGQEEVQGGPSGEICVAWRFGRGGTQRHPV